MSINLFSNVLAALAKSLEDSGHAPEKVAGFLMRCIFTMFAEDVKLIPERALDPIERHKLGAHYTPRAYVERLLMPTIIEPLREEWEAVQAAAVTLAKVGKIDQLAYNCEEIAGDEKGEPVTRWDGRTYKKHPVTGEDVPDETARTQLYRYVNPRKAEWPKADYVVGNPPFIGNWRMRGALGDGYVEALRQVYSDVPESGDYVMYWWDNAANLARNKSIKRFGFIATNSLRQTFNRKVVQTHLSSNHPLSLVFAIPDHPWVDKVISESQGTSEGLDIKLTRQEGKIFADLTIGADVAGAQPLKANDKLSCPGVKLHGAGFIVTPEEAGHLGLHRIPGLENHIRVYRNGRDLTSIPRNVMVIDLFGLNIEEVMAQFPEVYQWVYERVKPEREAKAGRTSDSDQYAKQWWLFGKPRSELRKAIKGLKRYIATVETSKHRFFFFLDDSILPDNMLVNIALDDAFYLGVLSSRIYIR